MGGQSMHVWLIRWPTGDRKAKIVRSIADMQVRDAGVLHHTHQNKTESTGSTK